MPQVRDRRLSNGKHLFYPAQSTERGNCGNQKMQSTAAAVLDSSAGAEKSNRNAGVRQAAASSRYAKNGISRGFFIIFVSMVKNIPF